MSHHSDFTDETPFGDSIPDPRAEREIEEGLSWWGLLSVLDPQERSLIDWIYRVGGTYVEFERGTGFSRYKTRKLESSAFEKIRTYIEEAKG